MDYCIGCGWWIMILYLLEIGALFMVRGRPYSGETVVATLFSQANRYLQVWLAPMLSFDWNIIVPVALIVSSTAALTEIPYDNTRVTAYICIYIRNSYTEYTSFTRT